MPTEIEMWLHVDPQGRVLDVRALSDAAMPIAPVLESARYLRYKPFMRDGIPVEAWIQDTISLTAATRSPARTIPFPEIKDPAKITIQLGRSGCFGTCPSYLISIRGDGEVTYRGERFVSIPGTHSAHIDSTTVAALIERFQSANFLALDDTYRAGVTDNPTYCLSLNLDGRIKTVTDYVGGWVGMPPEVTELEVAVDQVSDSARWVSSSPGTLSAMQQAGISTVSPEATQILRAAIDAGALVDVRALLAAGTRLDSPPPKAGNSGGIFARRLAGNPLRLAAESRKEGTRAEMVQTLLASPAVHADQKDKQEALALAVEKGYLDIARTLIAAGANPRARFTGEYGEQNKSETYLMLAAASGVWAMLDDAVARPHDIHAVDANGRSALVRIAYSAPQHEDIFPLIDRLLAAGADRSELDRVLLDTCEPGWIPGLVARGGNINARNSKGNTPLFQACTVEGVQALLDAGADPSLRNHAGKTAIQETYTPDQGVEDPRAAVIRRFVQAKAHRTAANH